MALLAKEWRPDLQHPVLSGSVRVVTDGTVLLYRLMLPQERTTLVLMALITDFVDGVLYQLCGTDAPVRVMAIGANYFAFPDGMARTPEHLGTFVLMTCKTDLGLGGPGAYWILCAHDVMTVCARITRGSMRTHSPIHLQTTLMALRANGITLFGCQAFLGNNQHRFLPWRIHMFTHRTVTGFTASIGQGPAVLGDCERLYIFFMTLKTLVAAIYKSRTFQIRIQCRPVNFIAAYVPCHRPYDSKLEQDCCSYYPMHL